MKVYPLGRNLLILPIPEEELKTASGIILPNAALKSQYRKGFVQDRGIGDKWNDMCEFNRMDVVQFSRGAGVPVILENPTGELIEYLLVPYEKIHGVL